MLRLYASGNERAGKLFQEFALAVKGERALNWSRGLKDLLGIDDIADSEIEEDTTEDIAEITPEVWQYIVRKRLHCTILEIAESDYRNKTNELEKALTAIAEKVEVQRQKQMQRTYDEHLKRVA